MNMSDSESKSSKKGFSVKNETSIGYLEGILSIIINTILFGLKYWVGIISGSVAIIADAWHTLSDTLTSIVVIIGFKISSKPPDKKHPYGHGKAEIISSVIIGIFLAIVGFNFLVESIHRFADHQAASYGTLSVIIFIISVILKEGIARFAFWGGKKFESRSLLADGWHHRSDAIASFLILVGIFIGKYFWWIDSVMGVMVSFLIFHATFNILKDSISTLIGEEPDVKFKSDINEIVTRIALQNINLHHMHIHCYGLHKELTFHIELASDMKLKEAHKIADELEKTIKTEMNIDTTIHVEPVE